MSNIPPVTPSSRYADAVNRTPSRCVNTRGHDTRRWRSDVSSTVSQGTSVPARQCTVPGCDRVHKGRGLCDMHIQRLRRTGTTDSPVKTLAERFWPKVNKNGPVVKPELGRCWVWTAATKEGGYGVIRPEGQRSGPTLKAHRASLMLAGVDIEGLVVRHRCDNPPCVNPSHLETGEQFDNVTDMVRRRRVAKGEARSRLSNNDVRSIRRRAAAGERHQDIATAYGISRPNVSNIVSRKTWRHVK